MMQRCRVPRAWTGLLLPVALLLAACVHLAAAVTAGCDLPAAGQPLQRLSSLTYSDLNHGGLKVTFEGLSTPALGKSTHVNAKCSSG